MPHARAERGGARGAAEDRRTLPRAHDIRYQVGGVIMLSGCGRVRLQGGRGVPLRTGRTLPHATAGLCAVVAQGTSSAVAASTRALGVRAAQEFRSADVPPSWLVHATAVSHSLRDHVLRAQEREREADKCVEYRGEKWCPAPGAAAARAGTAAARRA
eukprot:7338023-Prymnesium_polylepis.1